MTGLVRVRVVPEVGDALDLALPGAVPVADLVPELARRASLTSAVRVVTAGGRELAAGAGLAEQGVPDGSVLALVSVDDGAAPQDDPAEAIAVEVATRVLGWHLRLVRPVALAVVGVLLAVGGAALACGPAWCGAVAAAAVVLLGGAAGLALHRRHDRLIAAAAGWAAVGFAAVAGQQHAGPVAACAAAAGTSLLLARALRDVGALLLPALVAAAALGALALLAAGTGLEAGPASALGLAGTAVLAPGLPRLALVAAGERPGPARELLRAMLAATAVAMVVLAAPAAASGEAGALLAVAVGVLAACRGSRHHGAVEVLSGVVTGLLIVLVAAIVTLLRQPAWSGMVGVLCLVVAGALGVLVLRAPGTGATVAEAESAAAQPEGDPRLALAVDRLEAVALVCLVPLLVWVAGAVPLVTGLVRR